MNLKKIVRVSSFDALRAEWLSRAEFCRAEINKYPRAAHGRREWEARLGSVVRCLGELNEVLK